MPIVEDIPITTEVVLQKPAVAAFIINITVEVVSTKIAITKAAINSVLLLPAIPELVQSFVWTAKSSQCMLAHIQLHESGIS